MAQLRYPLNSQVLAIFFPVATIPATPHDPKFTDRYSQHYGMLSFSLLFITHTFFQLSLHHFHLVSQSNSQSNPMSANIPDPTDKILGAPPPPSPSHSPELGCAGAQRIMFLGRLLGYPTHLLSGGPRLARVWLILDLARNRCLDSENQDTIDNSL